MILHFELKKKKWKGKWFHGNNIKIAFIDIIITLFVTAILILLKAIVPCTNISTNVHSKDSIH